MCVIVKMLFVILEISCHLLTRSTMNAVKYLARRLSLLAISHVADLINSINMNKLAKQQEAKKLHLSFHEGKFGPVQPIKAKINNDFHSRIVK